MSNPVWPSSLPQYVFTAGYDEKLGTNVVRTPMDAGPAKVRRRFTTRIDTFAVVVPLTTAEVATFETWFRTTIADGSLAWDWVHPRTQAVITFRIVIPPGPKITPEPGAKEWRLSMRLEVMP